MWAAGPPSGVLRLAGREIIDTWSTWCFFLLEIRRKGCDILITLYLVLFLFCTFFYGDFFPVGWTNGGLLLTVFVHFRWRPLLGLNRIFNRQIDLFSTSVRFLTRAGYGQRQNQSPTELRSTGKPVSSVSLSVRL